MCACGPLLLLLLRCQRIVVVINGDKHGIVITVILFGWRVERIGRRVLAPTALLLLLLVMTVLEEPQRLRLSAVLCLQLSLAFVTVANDHGQHCDEQEEGDR